MFKTFVIKRSTDKLVKAKIIIQHNYFKGCICFVHEKVMIIHHVLAITIQHINIWKIYLPTLLLSRFNEGLKLGILEPKNVNKILVVISHQGVGEKGG